MTAVRSVPSLETSPINEELARGFPWLRFERGIETEYWRHFYGEDLSQRRLNLALTFVLFVAFFGLDGLVLPSHSSAALACGGAVLLALLAVIGLTFPPQAARWYPRVILLVAPVALLVLVGITVDAEQQGAGQAFSTLVLATIVISCLIGLSFYHAVVCNLLALFAYVAAAAATHLPVEAAVYHAYVLLISVLVAASVSYSLERMQRRAWLEARLLEDMALRDGLTGIFNRRRFEDTLKTGWRQALHENRPLALLMIDIDCFKPFNDRYGHQAGDDVLRSVAAVLHRVARRSLDVAARYGGEEFAVALYGPDRKYAASVATRILEEVRQLAIPNDGSSVAPVVTVSIGLAFVVPAEGRSAQGLVQLADEALYAAKTGGRNRVQVREAEYEHMKTGLFRIDRSKN
jgi:diguanylate cyclase (GGDEF)-like protein